MKPEQFQNPDEYASHLRGIRDETIQAIDSCWSTFLRHRDIYHDDNPNFTQARLVPNIVIHDKETSRLLTLYGITHIPIIASSLDKKYLSMDTITITAYKKFFGDTCIRLFIGNNPEQFGDYDDNYLDPIIVRELPTKNSLPTVSIESLYNSSEAYIGNDTEGKWHGLGIRVRQLSLRNQILYTLYPLVIPGECVQVMDKKGFLLSGDELETAAHKKWNNVMNPRQSGEPERVMWYESTGSEIFHPLVQRIQTLPITGADAGHHAIHFGHIRSIPVQARIIGENAKEVYMTVGLCTISPYPSYELKSDTGRGTKGYLELTLSRQADCAICEATFKTLAKMPDGKTFWKADPTVPVKQYVEKYLLNDLTVLQPYPTTDHSKTNALRDSGSRRLRPVSGDRRRRHW